MPDMTAPIDPREDQTRIPQQVTPGDLAAPVDAPRRRRWWVVAVAAVVVLAAGGGIAYAVMPGEDAAAADRCQQAISDKLKAPSTAEFGDPTVTVEEGNFATYYDVTGEVDAENGFGAMVRGDYRCKVTREQDGSWLVNSATFDQR